MAPLTNDTPKSMLRVGGVPLLQRILDQVLRLTVGEVTVVTGYRAEQVEELVARRYAGRVRCVRNSRFGDDLNILSVEVGVESLVRPDLGYTIIETDLLVERGGWETIFGAHRGEDSFWVTSGRYGRELTGGIVYADRDGRINAIDYRPDYDPAFDGWPKMLGIVSVSPECVHSDREARRRALSATSRQYYLAPWRAELRTLPCRVVDLGDLFARSFNTPAAFEASSNSFLAIEPRSSMGGDA